MTKRFSIKIESFSTWKTSKTRHRQDSQRCMESHSQPPKCLRIINNPLKILIIDHRKVRKGNLNQIISKIQKCYHSLSFKIISPTSKQFKLSKKTIPETTMPTELLKFKLINKWIWIINYKNSKEIIICSVRVWI